MTLTDRAYDMSIHHNPDARAWAKFFMETWEKLGKPEPDEGWMLGWFANAMMAMHDYMRPDMAPVVMPDGTAIVVATISPPPPSEPQGADR